MEKILYVGIGGLLGAISRYLMTIWSIEKFGLTFPYGTLLVNTLGCFILGVIVTIFDEKLITNDNIRLFTIVGFTGGLTTFSAFTYETIKLVENYNIFSAVLNVGLNIFLGILCITLGMALGKTIS